MDTRRAPREPEEAELPGRTAAAVRRVLPAVEPVAVLLTDDPGDATVLLAAALRGRGAVRDRRTALHRLVAAAHAAPPPPAAAAAPDLLHPADDAPLAAALADLSPADRAAAVLRLVPGGHHGGQHDAVDRLAAAVAARDEADRRAREEQRAVYLPPGTVPAPLPVRDDPLADRLAALARRRALPPGTLAALTAAVGAARRRRRARAVSATAALLVVAVLAVALPRFPTGGTGGSPAAASSVFAGPPRGSLADDAGFLRAVRAFSWAGSLGAPSPADRRVVYAGDGPGGRWVLATAGGSAARPASAAWFVGPRGADADDLSLFAARIDPDPAQPLAVTAPAAGDLVVVGLPGDRFQVSDRPEVDDRGTVTRTYRSVRTDGGVTRTAVPVLRGVVASAVQVRVERGGSARQAQPPDVLTDAYVTAVPLPVTRLRAAPPPAAGDAAAESRLRDLLGRLGESAPTADVTELWAGDLPGPQDRPARLSVLAVRRPSGAFVVTAPYGYAADLSGRSGSSFCVTGTIGPGEPLADRVVAVRCDLSDGAADRELSRFLVVIGPPATGSVRLRDVAGAQLGEQPAVDGVAVIRSPGPVAEVEAVLPDGHAVLGDLPADIDVDG
ncbi:hypothetical protein [Modestobacter sp. NPDC049651]|uniref:hypothetical protein n=1 Tax=unclassified Modestobacter TaxID=2643866 RepID=UPI0033C568F1